MSKLYLIGLTGNIATGKSTVARLLQEHGAHVIDADREAHATLTPGQPTCSQVVKSFGEGILTPAGQIDRAKLGAIVFRDAAALRRLEELVHPAAIERIKCKLKALEAKVNSENAGKQIVVVEAIKLLESGLAEICDSVWVVTCAREQQIQRLQATRALTQEEAILRIDAQPPQAEKIARADAVIDNSDALEETRAQVHRHLARIRSSWQRK